MKNQIEIETNRDKILSQAYGDAQDRMIELNSYVEEAVEFVARRYRLTPAERSLLIAQLS